MPKVTVVVPVYNVEKYLHKCAESILNQSFQDFELILVDDGSTDKSGDICDRFAEKDSRVRVIHQENGGLGAARNTGTREARGEWLLYVDSDDSIESVTIHSALRTAEANNADIVVFGFQSVDEDGHAVERFVDDIPKGSAFSLRTKPEMLLGAPVAWNKLYRLSLFDDIEYPGRAWYEDIRTTPKLQAEAKRIVYMEDLLYNYLMREGSITKNINVERNVEILEAFEDIIGWFKSKGWFENYKKEFEYLTVLHVYITASVRVIRVDPAHELLERFRSYLTDNFPDYKNNPYLKRLGRNKRLIMLLLDKKMYAVIRLIFKIKG